jgi:hypothetical protein
MKAKFCFLLVVAGLGTAFMCAQQTAPPAEAVSAATRPCSANPVLTYVPGKKAKKLKHPPAPEPVPTCVEVKGDPFGIQEFLQNLAREQSWRTAENHASEDMWSFVRYFNPDELNTYADTKVLIEPVKFSSGKAATTIRTTDLGANYVRVQISVHMQGEGKSTDPTWTQPATVWPLHSKGVFEKELVTALQTTYKPLD